MTVSLAFLGDGLIAGGQWEEWFPEHEVHNLAASGNTTDEVMSQLDQVIELRPDAIVIGVGTNDLGWRKSDEYVVRNLETILHTLRRALPETRIMVQSVLPRDRHLNEAGYAAWLAELRPGLEMLFEHPPSTTSIPIQHA